MFRVDVLVEPVVLVLRSLASAPSIPSCDAGATHIGFLAVLWNDCLQTSHWMLMAAWRQLCS